MNKKNPFLLMLALPFCVFAGTPSAEEILNYPEEIKSELVYATGFENPEESAIKLGEGFRFARGEGNNGNTGLRGDRVGKVNRTLHTIVTLPKEKIVSGARYKVTINVKGKDLRHVTRAIPPTSHRFMEIFYTDAKMKC